MYAFVCFFAVFLFASLFSPVNFISFLFLSLTLFLNEISYSISLVGYVVGVPQEYIKQKGWQGSSTVRASFVF